MNAMSSDVQQQVGMIPGRVRVFINYRRDDTRDAALLLYERLENRFGKENVFLDVRSVLPGVKWLDQIKSHTDSSHVFLSLIGSSWISIMRTRQQQASLNSAEDYVRSEIERALSLNSGTHVVPVLWGDNVSFKAEDLPRSLRALEEHQYARIRHEHFDQDIKALIGRIEEIARKQPPAPPEKDRRPPPTADRTKLAAPPPDAGHCEEVLEEMVDKGNLVLFLGSWVAAGRASATEGPSSRPDAEELAAHLAGRFSIRQAGLPQIAQSVYATKGLPDLYKELKQFHQTGLEPGPVHRFLARFPRMLEGLGLEKRYPLVVSTNFDRVLEQAFDEEREPYDLAVYMAEGPDQGKFVHLPFDGAAKPITQPNSYVEFPIGDNDELFRTVIVKIHGAADNDKYDYRWTENYVITEDDYIDYLSRSPIENLVPVQILGKLRQSHCLFLGYTVRDWNLRVFLKRIWQGGPGANSWAVEPDPDAVERALWRRANVDLFAGDLAGYVRLLEQGLIERTSASIGP